MLFTRFCIFAPHMIALTCSGRTDQQPLGVEVIGWPWPWSRFCYQLLLVGSCFAMIILFSKLAFCAITVREVSSSFSRSLIWRHCLHSNSSSTTRVLVSILGDVDLTQSLILSDSLVSLNVKTDTESRGQRRAWNNDGRKRQQHQRFLMPHQKRSLHMNTAAYC